MIQPPFPSTIAPQPRPVAFLTTKHVVRKTRKTMVRLPCLDHAVLAQGGVRTALPWGYGFVLVLGLLG